jgi:hypothetical protein
MYQQVQIKGIDQEILKRLSDNAFIPHDPANSDYQRYLKWLDGYEEVNGEWVKTSEGNTPLPADQE